jgi:hypothetical protein
MCRNGTVTEEAESGLEHGRVASATDHSTENGDSPAFPQQNVMSIRLHFVAIRSHFPGLVKRQPSNGRKTAKNVATGAGAHLAEDQGYDPIVGR